MTLVTCLKSSSSSGPPHVLRSAEIAYCLHLPEERQRERLQLELSHQSQVKVPEAPPEAAVESSEAAKIAIVTGMELLSRHSSASCNTHSIDDHSFESFAADSLRLAHRKKAPVKKKARCSIHKIVEADEKSCTTDSMELVEMKKRKERDGNGSCLMDSSSSEDEFDDFCNDSFSRLLTVRKESDDSISHCTAIPNLETYSCSGAVGRAA